LHDIAHVSDVFTRGDQSEPRDAASLVEASPVMRNEHREDLLARMIADDGCLQQLVKTFGAR
jgi:hypothetical protein